MSSADAALEQLIERLLTDAQFRAELRRAPAATLAAAGLPELAADLGAAGSAMHTLTLRESRSSLAGVVMAMAVEGMSVGEAHALLGGGLHGHARLPLKAPHEAALERAAGHRVAHGVGAGARALGGGAGSAPASAAHGTGSAAAAPGASGASGGPGENGAAGTSAAPSAPAGNAAAAAPAAAGTSPAPPVPGAQPIQGGAVPQWPEMQPSGAPGGAGPDMLPDAGAPGGSAIAGSAGVSPMQLLESPRLGAPPAARAFLTSGQADPRLVSVLGSALANHSIGLGPVEAVSDPVHAQAVTIVSVDGQPVGPDNLGARDLVTEIAAMDPSVRPSEIGTPWPIHSPGFFSDPAATDRLRLAFEMPSTNAPPAGAGVGVGVGQVAYPAPLADHAMAPLSAVAPAPMAASTHGSGVDAALAYARAMIGKLPESAGNNLGPQLDKFEADFGFHGAAWCGIFAGHVLEAAGLHPPHSVAAVASILDLARNGDPPFVKGILPVSEARPGDLVTFGGTEHVAVVTKVDAAGIHTIAGNTSQSNVSETTYSPGSVTGVVRPDYAGGKPGSVPGVWNYAGVQPPPAGAAPPPTAVPAAAEAGTPSPANALAPTPEPAPPPQQPAPLAFNAHAPHGHVRPTVRFLPAVQPSPGSPLYVGEPGAGTAAPAADQTAAPAGQASAGVPIDQMTPSPGGSLTVSSSLLTDGQAKFAARLAELTGLDPRVVAAWELAEESGGAAQAREAAGNFNWLNIGYFDSGAGRIAFDQAFSDPTSAAEQTAKFLKGTWGGASTGIRAILSTTGQGPQQQMTAIANSGWASSHYGGGANLRGTYDELGDIHVVRTGST